MIEIVLLGVIYAVCLFGLAFGLYLVYVAKVEKSWDDLLLGLFLLIFISIATSVFITVNQQNKYYNVYDVYCESASGRVLYDGQGTSVHTDSYSSAITGYSLETGRKFTITGECVVDYVEKREKR